MKRRQKFKLILLSLILSCFFLTSISFAASDGLIRADRHASKVTVSNISVKADGESKVFINIYLYDRNNEPEKDTVFIATDRGSTDTFWIKESGKWKKVGTDSSKDVYYIDKGIVKAKIDKKLELGLTSGVRGNPKLGVSLKDDEGRAVWQYVTGKISEGEAEIIEPRYKDKGEVENGTKVEDYKDIFLNQKNPLKTFTNNPLDLEVLDKDKKAISVEKEVSDLRFSFEVLEAPKNAKLEMTEAKDFQEGLYADGLGQVFFKADKTGKYKVKYSLEFRYPKASFNQNFSIENTQEFEVVNKVFGAEHVTLFIGKNEAVVDGVAKNLALSPFIENNRTYLPLRFVAETLGAKVDWNEGNQSIIITREDKTVSMTIGNKTIISSKDKPVVSDVAPFIKDSYTVLPFRVLAEIFGANVEAISDANGLTEKVIFSQN